MANEQTPSEVETREDSNTDPNFHYDGNNNDELNNHLAQEIANGGGDDADGHAPDFVDPDEDPDMFRDPDELEDEDEDAVRSGSDKPSEDTEEKPSPESESPEDETPTDENADEPKNKSVRVRLNPVDEQEAQALELKKRNPDMSLQECLDRVKGEETGDDTTEAEQPSESQQEHQDLLSQIADLETKQIELTDDLEFAEAQKLNSEIRQLERKAVALEIKISTESEHAQNEAKAQQEQEFTTQEEASKAKAVENYPDVTDPDSKLVARMMEIDAQLKDLNDDLYYSPEKHFTITQMAARDLSIPPKAKRTASPAQGTPQRAPAAQAPPLASGGAQTTPSDQSDKFNSALSAVQTGEDYEDFVASIT